MRPLSFYKELAQTPRHRTGHGFFLVEGIRAVSQIAATAPGAVDEILLRTGGREEIPPRGFIVRKLDERQFKSIAGSVTPQGIAAVVRMPGDVYSPALPENPGKRVLLLEGVQDPGNAGTLIRTAVAFGYDGVIMSQDCADPFSPKAVQASAGAVLSLWIRRCGEFLSLASALRQKGFASLAATLAGPPIGSEPLQSPHIVMLGSEGAGLSPETLAIADRHVRIPMHEDRIESLNVAASGAVLMFLGRESA